MTESTHWCGPYGILVPNHIKYVKSTDGANTLYPDGFETEMVSPEIHPTEEEYKKKYASFNETDGRWYYKLPLNAEH